MREIIRDTHGRKIAEIKQEGNHDVIRDEHGKKLGTFDGKETRDAHGKKVGNGNLLKMLINVSK